MLVGSPVAIIRAAGKGERLKPYTDYYQKCILPINGKPLLAHWLDALANQPIHIYANVFYNYHPQQVISVVQTWERRKNGHFYFKSDDASLQGMVPGYEKGPNLVYVPTEFIKKDYVWQDTLQFYELHQYLKKRPILFCLADNYSPILHTVLYKLLHSRNSLNNALWGIIGLIKNEQCSSATQEAVLEFDRTNFAYVKEYRYGLSSLPMTGLHSWAGIALFSPDVLQIKDVRTMPELFAWLAQQGRLVGHIITDPYWDIGIPEHYEKACNAKSP